MPPGGIHQEDFNQALATGNQKYQKYGGKASLARIARAFTAVGDRDSLERLFKLVVVSVAVGNLDMHAKNISLLHHPDGSMMLSPVYDIQPQAHQANDGEVALAVDGEYHHAALTRDHLIAEGSAWGLLNTPNLTEEALISVLHVATTEFPHEHAHTGLAQEIAGFASNLLAGRAIGTSDHLR
jgi:serine/threonine-protein kinase HipA